MRLFVAADLPEGARARLAAWARAAAPEGVRLVAPENLHLTLAFLGSRTDAHVLAPLVEAVARPVGAQRTAAALWLPPRRPGVLTVALTPEDGMAALRSDLVATLARAVGWEPERRAFRPHVTVGRVRRDARVRAGDVDPPAPVLEFSFPSLTLYRSVPGPGGSRYEALASAPLG